MVNMYKSYFKVLWNLVKQEGGKDDDKQCLAASRYSPYMQCNRITGHKGLHIALGNYPYVYEVWKDLTHYVPEDSKVMISVLGLLYQIVHRKANGAPREKTCGKKYGALGCCRMKNHSGLCVAIGGEVCAIWDSKVIESDTHAPA